MTVAFVRQVGHESNVQLNPVRDRSEMPSNSVSDQVFGTMMRCTRGFIDRAFKVDRSNVYKKLGAPQPVRQNDLNVAMIDVVEALNNGAYEAVISRIVPAGAKIKWLVCTLGEDGALEFSVTDESPEIGGETGLQGFFFALKHLECFNDGIKVSLHAEGNWRMGEWQPTDVVTLRILDNEDEKIYEFTGSLNQNAKDDYGEPMWLPDVINKQTTALEFLCVTDGVVQPDFPFYGDNALGQPQWVQSPVMICFEEGGTVYEQADLVAARNRLQYTPHNYAYLASCQSKSPMLIAQLAQLAFDTNTQLRFDIDGELPPDAAIAFMEEINATGQKEAHLLHAFWFPAKSNDPTGVNGKDFWGVATLNIAFACGRNAQKNAKGFAPKNYPVAGKDWPINRQGIVQTYTPTAQELSKLAKAKINVCCYEEYDSGGRYVFRDSLTCAPVDNSLKKLIAVADMACHTDDAVTRFAKAALQKPMTVSVRMMRDFLRDYFQGAEEAEWIVPASEPSMGGAAARYFVGPSEARPYEEMVVSYDVRYDGTNRVTTVTQTFVK